MDAEEKSGRHGHGLTLEGRPAVGTHRPTQFHAYTHEEQMQRYVRWRQASEGSTRPRGEVSAGQSVGIATMIRVSRTNLLLV